MYQKVTTLTDFLLKEEHVVPQATGAFTLLMTHIENAAKVIASHIKRSGLVDIVGASGRSNAFGDEVQKLDEFANEVLLEMIIGSRQACAVMTEELEKPAYADKECGKYVVYLDPLDGSSNIDVNVSIGTIFSIYLQKKKDSLLYPGTQQIASGYILYGPSVLFVYTYGQGVNGFTLDPASGLFLLSHPEITMPPKGSIYSINEAYYQRYDKKLQKYLDHLKEEKNKTKARYVGSMVADVHRTLLKGGIFLYPADSKNPNGKLRLMYEVSPMSFLIEQAGGMAMSSRTRALEIAPQSHEQRVPIVLGSKENVETYMRFVE